MADNTGRDSDKFMLRLPDGMRDRIKASAETNGRSMNAEIVHTLEEKYPKDQYSAEEFLELLGKLTEAQTDGDLDFHENMLNDTLKHLGFSFTAKITNGAVAFFTDDAKPHEVGD